MVMQQQNPGWASTPMASGTNNVDTFSRIMAMRYGGRTDDIWSYLDQPGYRRDLGPAASAPGGGWSYNTGSGGVTLKGIGRGNTPSDPGDYNWGTLARGVTNVKQNVINPILDKVMPTTGKSGQPAFRTGGIYGQYRGKQQQVQKAQTYQAAQQARQQQAQLNTFAGNTFATSMGLRAGVQAGKSALKPGASSPMPRGGTPAPGPVNLLTGPTALGQPAKKPRAARSTTRKPKATRPATPNTYDPSIW